MATTTTTRTTAAAVAAAAAAAAATTATTMAAQRSLPIPVSQRAMAALPVPDGPHLHRVRPEQPLVGWRPELTRSPDEVQRPTGRGPSALGDPHPQRFLSGRPASRCRCGSKDRSETAFLSSFTRSVRPRSSPASSQLQQQPPPPPPPPLPLLRLTAAPSSSEESIVVLPPVPAPRAGAPTSSLASSANVPNFSRQSLFRLSKHRGRSSHHPLHVLQPINTTTRSRTDSLARDLAAPATSSAPHASQRGCARPASDSNHPTTRPRLTRERRYLRNSGYNPFNLPSIPSPLLDASFDMTTSPQAQSPPSAVSPSSPTNHTPKDLRASKPPSTASSAHRHREPDTENQPQLPNSPSDHSLPWTPQHPCYPHPNPHVPRQDPRADSTRIIRVQRDWSEAGDLYPQFSDTYPEILAPWITEREFRSLVAEINATSHAAFDPRTGRAWVDSLMGFATGWLWEDLGLTGGHAGARKCERIISAWNVECRRRRAADRGTPAVAVEKDTRITEVDLVECIPLRRTAWMSLDFVIPDPKISLVPEKPAEPQPQPAPTSARITPRGSGERLGEKDRREPSRKSSRKPSAEKFSPGGPSGSTSIKEKVGNEAEDWATEPPKGPSVGMAL